LRPFPLEFSPLVDYQFTLNLNGVAGTPQLSDTFTSLAYPGLLIPGTHTITVEYVNGCIKTSLPFTINPSDVDELTLSIDNGGLNEIIATSTGGSGGNVYSFNGINNGSDNSYIITVSGTYTVRVTDDSGCYKEDSKFVPFIPIVIPNVFTPGDNGINDGWAPQNTSNYKDLITYIYDRYGRKVKELREGEFWDGKYENKELPTGDYWYVIKVNENDDREYVGHFTLYR
jgi:large repetitive protein